MILLIHEKHCPLVEELAEALRQIVIAHRVVVRDSANAEIKLPPATPLPALVDARRVFAGRAAIAAHIEELSEEMARWQLFQSDACYLDEDGRVC